MKNTMYIVINEDLNMSPGKIGAHTAHAAFDYWYRYLPDAEEDNKHGYYMIWKTVNSRSINSRRQNKYNRKNRWSQCQLYSR